MTEPDISVKIIKVLRLFPIEKNVTILSKYMYQGLLQRKKALHY